MKNKLKRGKGSQRQVSVAVIAGSVPLEDLEGKESLFCGYFKIQRIPN